MSWPPSEEEWIDILKDVSPPDWHATRAAVERAVDEYGENAERDEAELQLRNDIKRQADLEGFRALCNLMDDLLQRCPDDLTLRQQLDVLHQIYTHADIRAAVLLPSSRRERFLAALSLAWTGPGKGKLPIAEVGPHADFMCAITDRVLPHMSSSGIKAFARRERVRRKALHILDEVLRGQGEFKATGFLIDADGRPKPD
jgi:hypothetical protein